jgi:hypothetical protein
MGGRKESLDIPVSMGGRKESLDIPVSTGGGRNPWIYQYLWEG